MLEKYEEVLGKISAKEVLKFRGLTGKGSELKVGLALLYLLATVESTIVLKTDRRSLLTPTWDEVKKTFANGGKVAAGLKKVKDYIENDMVS